VRLPGWQLLAVGLCALALSPRPAAALSLRGRAGTIPGLPVDEEGVPVNGVPVGVNDDHGYRWDFQSNGTVMYGTGSLFYNAMRLNVNGWEFTSRRTVRVKDSNEFIFGPTTSEDGLLVIRRVRVDAKSGRVSHVDIFHNPTPKGKILNVRLSVYFQSYVRSISGSSGSSGVGPQDCGLVAQGGSSSRPYFGMVFASPNAHLRPEVLSTARSQRITASVTSFMLASRETVAFAWVTTQRRDRVECQAFVREFDSTRFLQSLPKSLRAAVANFRPMTSAALLTLGDLPLVRAPELDRIYQSEKGFLVGRILEKELGFETPGHGTIRLPLERAAALLPHAGGLARPHRLFLADGQVISGRLTGTLRFLLASSKEENVFSPAEILKIGFRIPKKERESSRLTSFVTLNSGDRVRVEFERETLRVLTNYGEIALRLDQITQIVLRAGEVKGVKPGVYLRDGSRLIGLISESELALRSPLLGSFRVKPREIRHLVLRPLTKARRSNEPELTLCYGDKLIGRFTAESVTVLTPLGRMEFSPHEIASFEFSNRTGAGASVRLKFVASGSLRGELEDALLGFRLRCGVDLGIPQELAVTYRNPQPRIPRGVAQCVITRARDLTGNDEKKRAAAKARLLKFGPSIRPVLEKILGETNDPATRLRLDEVLRELKAGSK